MKTILLCSDGSSFADTIYRYGAWFAHQFQAQVKVLFVTDIRSQQVVSTGNLSGSIGLGASENLLTELVNLEHEKAKLNNKRARLILNHAEERLKIEGVETVELINKTGFLVDCFHEFEETTDLVVLGKRGEAAKFASGHLGANVDRIIRSSSKPCLVTPQTYVPLERLLLAYDGSPTGQKLLAFLAQASGLHGLGIHLVMVAKSEADARSDQKKQEQEAAVETLKSAGLDPVVHIIAGDPEKVISHYVEQQQISLLLMGAYGHRRIRHLMIGSTTEQLLRSAQIPVLLFR